MPKIRISAIAAIGETSRVLGDSVRNDLVFKLKADLAHFKKMTMGRPVIMGRKTWDSIDPKFRPLKGRANIVVTRNPGWKADGVIVANSVAEAIREAQELEIDEIFIIGGGEIYKQALPFTDRLYLTLVKSDAQGDVLFPEYENEFTKVVEPAKDDEQKGEENGIRYEFVTLER